MFRIVVRPEPRELLPRGFAQIPPVPREWVIRMNKWRATRYGIDAEEKAYDDYAHLDVQDKIVVVLRYEPPSFSSGEGSRRYRLFDLRVLLRRGFFYSIISTGIFAVYGAILLLFLLVGIGAVGAGGMLLLILIRGQARPEPRWAENASLQRHAGRVVGAVHLRMAVEAAARQQESVGKGVARRFGGAPQTPPANRPRSSWRTPPPPWRTPPRCR